MLTHKEIDGSLQMERFLSVKIVVRAPSGADISSTLVLFQDTIPFSFQYYIFEMLAHKCFILCCYYDMIY